MEKRKCKVCGGDIVCIIKRAELYFYINDKGNVMRDENPELWEYNPIKFQCEHDNEHEIEADEEWKEKFKEKVYRLI